jgi:glycosyltransferase involved in cell wall biosynthesis
MVRGCAANRARRLRATVFAREIAVIGFRLNFMRLLYIVYWGALEPLGQALVVPPVCEMAARGTQITLITFEKPHHWADEKLREATREKFKAANVRWIPLRYHRRPTAPATLFDISQGALRGVVQGMKSRPDVVIGRTFVGGLIGQMVARVLRRPFVFHAEGFWPDEQVDAGFWTREGRPYKLTKRWEVNMLRRAQGAIVLCNVARDMVLPWRENHPDSTTVVVPSCVDLKKFQPESRVLASRESPKLVYLGSLGGRYRVDSLARFFKAVQNVRPGATLEIISPSDVEMVGKIFQTCDIEKGAWTMHRLPHHEVPAALAACDAGLHFLSPGINARVGSPTKIGEYWACGLPVVTTPDVGDVDAVVRRERVGVVVDEDTVSACERVADELNGLLRDENLAVRCRAAAENHYALERGVGTQLALYEQLSTRN